MWKIAICAVLTLAYGTRVNAIDSYQYTMALGGNQVQARAFDDDQLGNYFTVTLKLPMEELADKKIRAVFLEFYADVSTTSINGAFTTTPVVQVFALTQPFSGSLNPANFDRAAKANRPVLVGNNRRIRVDVTRLVKRLMKDPAAGHTLVVGSLEHSREGLFNIRSGVLPGDALAQIRFYFE